MNDISEIKIDVDKNDVDIIDVDKDKIDADKNNVDKIDVDKIFHTFDNIDDKPHNGKPITIINVSPDEKYLVTYSKVDCSIVGWSVEDLDKGQLKLDITVQPVKIDAEISGSIGKLYVSNNKKLVYTYGYANNYSK
jgi:hypothetical protein